MELKDLEILVSIYNALNTISTNGKDTVIMGKCLETFENFLLSQQKQIENNKKEE